MLQRMAILLALGLAACGGEERAVAPAAPAAPVAPGAPSAPAWEPPVDVATLRTVGDLPPVDRRIEIVVDAAGALTVDGRATDFAGLTRALQDAGGGGETSQPAGVDALLVLDRSLPWRVAQLCMQECASANVSRVFFAVRHAGDGEPGAFAAFLPRDVGVRAEQSADVAKIVARVRLTGEMSFPLPAFEPVIARYAAEHTAAPRTEIDAAGDAPLAYVLSVADAAARGGAGSLTFVGTPGSIAEGGLPAEVERHSRIHLLGPDLEVLGVARVALSLASAVRVPPEPPPRVVGRYAGFAASPSLAGLEQQQEALVEEER